MNRAYRWTAILMVSSFLMTGCGDERSDSGGTAEPGGGATPRETLEKLAKGTPDVAAACFDAKTEDRDLAQFILTVFSESRRLDAAVASAYGVEDFISPLGKNNPLVALPPGKTLDDIAIGQEGDRATCTIPGREEPLDMVRKDGRWLVRLPKPPTDKERAELTKEHEEVLQAVKGAIAKVGKPGYTPKKIRQEMSATARDFLWRYRTEAAPETDPETAQHVAVAHGSTTPKPKPPLRVELVISTRKKAQALCDADAAVVVVGGPKAGTYPLAECSQLIIGRNAKGLRDVSMVYSDGSCVRAGLEAHKQVTLPEFRDIKANNPNEFLTKARRVMILRSGVATPPVVLVPKPTGAGKIPPAPKPTFARQQFVLYDVAYIKDEKLGGYGIVARVWARTPQAYKKPGMRATFLKFSKQPKGDLADLTFIERTFTVNLGAGGKSMSWDLDAPKSDVAGRGHSLSASGSWHEAYGVVVSAFAKSFVAGKHAGYMLRDDKCRPLSNVLRFNKDAFKPGDINAVFKARKAEVDALKGSKK